MSIYKESIKPTEQNKERESVKYLEKPKKITLYFQEEENK